MVASPESLDDLCRAPAGIELRRHGLMILAAVGLAHGLPEQSFGREQFLQRPVAGSAVAVGMQYMFDSGQSARGHDGFLDRLQLEGQRHQALPLEQRHG